MITTGTTNIYPKPVVVCPTCHHCPTCGREVPQPFQVQWQTPYQQQQQPAPWYATTSGPALTPISNVGGAHIRTAAADSATIAP